MESPNSKTVSTKQNRIAKLSQEIKGPMKSLNHYLDMEWLRAAYSRTRKDGATGIDGMTAAEYEKNLESNLERLLNQAKAGTYFAPPVKRAYIPKPGNVNEKRPIGICTFEDKVLQRAIVMMLEPIFETKFKTCSYGFRPDRSAHQSIEAVWRATMNAPDGWIIDLDIKSFFDEIDKRQLKDFLEEWVQDGVILRLIGKWLKAGIMEGQQVVRTETGAIQGGVISPLLSNLYLHHVLDVWIEEMVNPILKKPAQLIRYADDALIVFKHKSDAQRVMKVIAKRFSKYGLRLHPEKTKLIHFHSPDKGDDQDDNHFDFLGFRHYWGRSRKGDWVVKRKTQKDRLRLAISKLNLWCKKNRHKKLTIQWESLCRKLTGHYGYYGITGNGKSLGLFRYEVRRIWKKWLNRRDRSDSMTWSRMDLLLQKYPLPNTKIVHSYLAAKL